MLVPALGLIALAPRGRPRAASPELAGERNALVVLPDTQFYASTYPEIFRAQLDWIMAEQDARGIAAVLHSGDIVDAADDPAQWWVASDSLHRLDGVLPYVLAAGNHDYGAERQGELSRRFPPSSFTQYAWFGGTYEPGRIANSYSFVELGGQRWLIVALEFGPRDDVLAWAAHIVQRHAVLPTIVLTHAYLYGDGSRYDHRRRPAQRYNPHAYDFTPAEGINDGEQIWRRLIEPHANIRLVLSGHVAPNGVARKVSFHRDGSAVHELLANYQTCLVAPCEIYQGRAVHGGDGYLRLLTLEPATGVVQVQTYSPYLRRYLHDADNEFAIDLKLTAPPSAPRLRADLLAGPASGSRPAGAVRRAAP